MKNNENKRVYISGLLPLVSSRREGLLAYRERLRIAESAMFKFGYSLVNMAELELMLGQRSGKTQDIHQKVSLAMLRCCDMIYMVKGWEDSDIAVEEKRIAEEKGLEVLFENENHAQAVITGNNRAKRVYISGLLPLVGSRREGLLAYRERLRIAESSIYKLGYNIVNMAELELGLGQRSGKTQDIHQKVSLAMLRCCDMIYMVKGWEDNDIAVEEKRIAEEEGLEVLFEPQQSNKEAA